MPNGVLSAYDARCADGRLAPDPLQRDLAERLQELHGRLGDWRPRRGGILATLGFARRRFGRYVQAPRGLYIHGPPGRGKSMLMDLFFETAPVERRRRVHIHGFMQQVHEQLHGWRMVGGGRQAFDPLPRLARLIADGSSLLCFDEFQIEAVADAMILRRLFETMMDCGVVVVATSNTAPDDLYAGGLQRERFLPFIAMIKDRLDVVEIDGPTDYRCSLLATDGVYHSPLGRETDAALAATFRALTGGADGAPDTLQVNGRELIVPRQANGVARFDFDQLCGSPLGPADYLRIACRFQTLILSGIPRMGPERRDEARRFATLVESLYEQRAKLVCAAEVGPQALYTRGDGAQVFGRVVSRLREMQSEDYLALPHRPATVSATAAS